MWLTLYVTLLIFLLYQSFFWSPLHLYVVSCVLYVLVYMLHAQHREWHWFRSWAFWDYFRRWYFPHNIHSIHWGDMTTSSSEGDGRVYLFVVVDPVSLIDTVLAFGLHGKKNPVLNRLSPLILAPSYLFHIPYITDAAQWAGLVPEQTRSKCYTEVVNDILSGEDFAAFALRRSLVVFHYRRSGYPDGGNDGGENIQFVGWAAERAKYGLTHLCLVPVIHRGSSLLYRSCGVQGQRHDGEPFHWRSQWPFFGLGYMGTCLPRRTELNTFVGRPIPVIDNAAALSEAFSRELASLRRAANENASSGAEAADWDIERGEKI